MVRAGRGVVDFVDFGRLLRSQPSSPAVESGSGSGSTSEPISRSASTSTSNSAAETGLHADAVEMPSSPSGPAPLQQASATETEEEPLPLGALALLTDSAVIVTDGQGRIEWVNDGFVRLCEFSLDEVKGKTPGSFLQTSATDSDCTKTIRERIREGKPFKGEIANRSKSGREYWVSLEIKPVRSASGRIDHFIGLAVEITESKNKESELRESEEKYALAVLCASDGLWNWNIVKNEIYISPRLKELLHIPERALRKGFDNFLWRLHPEDHERVMKAIQDHLERRIPYDCEYRLRVDTGEYRWFQARGQAFWDENDKPIRMAGSIIDVTDRKRIEEEIVGLNVRLSRRLDRLAVLRRIDRAVASSLDLRLTLDIILEQSMQHLHAQAGMIWIHPKHSVTLEPYLERGFPFGQGIKPSLRLGEGQAGRAAYERRAIFATETSTATLSNNSVPRVCAGRPEERECYGSSCSVPLEAKGEIKGVLELFYVAPTTFDPESIDFLEIVAGQAAVAMDDAFLFESLQRSNMELTFAYDATIEGWSRALDLRDKETEGHSRRVTELTVILARQMMVGEADMVNIRRGALLHDIGKMGVPDAILQKPGPLNESEQEIMRRHPRHAFDMLSPIEFLRPALEIPYCHHEKWDGTGYPRGLKGEQIPLSARIFAVVDVWDAIRSDRPYRKARSFEKSLQQIQLGSGNHFDPKVVEVFLEFIKWQHSTELGSPGLLAPLQTVLVDA